MITLNTGRLDLAKVAIVGQDWRVYIRVKASK